MRYLQAIGLLLATLLVAACELVTPQPAEGAVHYIAIGLDYHTGSAQWGPLSGPPNDATGVASALSDLTVRAERTAGSQYLMVQDETGPEGTPDTYPSAENVRFAIASIAAVSAEGDLTIFHYSGHGTTEDGSLVLAPDGGETETENSYLSPQVLLENLNKIEGKVLVLIDACYSGNMIGESPSSSSLVYWSDDYYEKYFSDIAYVPPDIFAITSSAKDTESYEPTTPLDEHIHGYFSYALIQGLSAADGTDIPAARNGVITADTLYEYVLDHQKVSSNRLSAIYQHPMASGGAMDLVLFRLP